MDIEGQLLEVVSRFAASDEVAEEVAYDILDWLDERWEARRVPEIDELRAVHRQLIASFGDGHQPTYEQRAARALLMVAAELDDLEGDLLVESSGRDDLPVWAARFRRAVLEMGLPVRDHLLGELALELIAEADQVLYTMAIATTDLSVALSDLRRTVELLRGMEPPSSSEAAVMVDAALVAGHHMLGEFEHSFRIAGRLVRRRVDNHQPVSVGLFESLRIAGSFGVRAGLESGRDDDALRLSELAELRLRELDADVPGDIYVTRLDVLLGSDPGATYALASELLRERLATGSPEDSDVLRIAQRLIVSGFMTEQPAILDVMHYWRTVALGAPPSLGSDELLTSIQVVGDDDQPYPFTMPELDVPDHPGELE